jgi:hypothetical protein
VRKARDPRMNFLDHVRPASVDECWPWQGSMNLAGYGCFWIGHNINAHRAAYLLFVGDLAAREEVHHKCENRACVNWVKHLQKATSYDHRIHLSPAQEGYKNARKTHCPHGHEFTPQNTLLDKKNRRRCRACCAASCKQQYRKRMAS